jgi:hypothetical protein
MHNVCDYGAAGDGRAIDTAAFQKAIDACASAGGGTVLVPAGRAFRCGTFRLKSHVNLHLEGGALILGSGRKEDYPNEELRCLIEARDAEDVSLTGTGVIDGQAKLFMEAELPYIYRGNPWRPRLMGLIGCRKVVIRDVTLRDSANWGLHLTGCENVVIHGVSILNDLKVPNCDGIDPDHCRNVRISDCLIEAGDDCIVVKNTRPYERFGPTENITVTGCVCKSTSAAIKIGTESVSDFRNLVFEGCVVQSSSRGLAIQLRDEGNVENVIFSNCIVETRLFYEAWWGAAEPIYVTAFHRSAGSRLGRIRNVRFSNVLCRGENGAFIHGCEESAPENVALDGVRLELDKWSKWPGGRHDRRPCDLEGIVSHRTAGIFAAHARNLTVRNCEVAWGANRPEYFGPALECHSTPGLRVESLIGEAAHPERDPAQVVD